MARHSNRCLLFAFQLRRSGVEVAKWFVCEKTYLAECGRSEDLIRKTTNRCTEKVPRGSESKESLDENPIQKNWKDRESNICRI